MKFIKLACLLWAISFSSEILAQQLPVISSFYNNPFIANPAMAGSKGSNLNLLSRSPWNGKQNNPETFLGTFDGMLNNGVSGFGLTVFNEKISTVGKTGIFGTYSYKLPLPSNGSLSIGSSLGFEQNNVLYDRVKETSPEELAILGNVGSKNSIDANIGLAYIKNKLYVGLATYQLFNNNTIVVRENFTDKYTYHFNKQVISTASYRFDLMPGVLSLTPVFQSKLAKNIKPQNALLVTANFKNKFWTGAGYRQNYGVDVLAGIMIGKWISLNYSYGLSTGNTLDNNPTAHEIMFGLKLPPSKSKRDTDKDGIPDIYDREINTPEGCKVNKIGVAADEDRDGIADCIDKQAETQTGAPVNADGVALDNDFDGVIDFFDREPNSVPNCLVDALGIALDGDKDFVPDCLDKEPNSHWAAKVDADGVAIDTDKDHIPDVLDLEIETPHWKHISGKPGTNASNCIVDANGITKDSDADGVPDCVDAELLSPTGSKVDVNGVSISKQAEVIPEKSKDSDGDGIADELDLEPNTALGSSVDQWGRSPQVNADPASIHRIEIDQIEDNSSEWDYYVIIGVFRYYNNLKNYQKYLLKTYDEPTQVLVTQQNYYYAWTRQITTKAEAEREVNRLSQAKLKDYIVGNPWMWREPKQK